MKKLFSTKTILLSMILSSFFLTSCLSTYLIPDKMEKNDLGKKNN